MKKLLFLLLMTPLITYASNWVLAGEGATSGNKVFIDTQSINRSGNSVTFWQRVNYGTRSPQGDLSNKIHRTINCRTREVIARYFMIYDDLNNNGKLTLSVPANDSDKWLPIAPDTVDEFVMKFVCKR